MTMHVTPSKPTIIPSSSPRLRSPRGSPRIYNGTGSFLYSLLKHTKSTWFMALMAVIALFALRRPASMEPVDLSFIDLPPVPFAPVNDQPTSSDSLPKFDGVSPTQRNSPSIPSYQRPQTTTTTQSNTQDDVFSSYNASLSPIFSEIQNIQVHVVVDVSHSIDPPAKFILDGVERSKYTQVVALTFLNPSRKTVRVHPRKPNLPLVWMVDWGSLQRDCHRLERVLQDRNARSLIFHFRCRFCSRKPLRGPYQIYSWK